MGTSIFSAFPSPVPAADSYQMVAGAELTLIVTDVFTNSPGLLENDQAISGGNGFSLEVTGVGSSPEGIEPSMTLTSVYGQWTVDSNGGFTYVADGLASKQLADDQSAIDVLYYLEINGFSETAVGQATMTISGTYDPLEVIFDGANNFYVDEDAWLQQNQTLPLVLPIPSATVTFIDNNAQPQLTAYYRIDTNIPTADVAVYDEYVKIIDEIQSSVQQLQQGGNVDFDAQLSMSQTDFGFLRPGDSITIEFYSTVSDGTTVLTSPVSRLVIDGVNHAILLNPDHALVMQGQVIEAPGAGSVLDNDVDPDAEGAMEVLGVSSAVSPTAGILPDGSYASIDGQYGTLTINNQGDYGYVPFPGYRYSLATVTDVFLYSAINEAIDANWGELTIEILPDPNVKVILPMENNVFFLDEGLAVIGGGQPVENGLFMRTTLDSLFVQSLSENLPQIEIFYEGLHISVPHNADLFVDAALRASLVIPFVEFVEQTDPANGVWTTRYVIGVDSLTDFQYLNDGDQITLTYAIHGIDQQIYSSVQTVYVVIEGENDAPAAADDHNIVYAGQSAVGVSDSASGLLFNDNDPDLHDRLHVSSISFGSTTASFTSSTPSPFDPLMLEGQYGWLTVYAGGDYTYTANKAAAQSIEPVSDTVDPTYEIFTYTVVDEAGAADEQQLVIQVIGPHDKPTAMDDVVVVYLETQDPTHAVYNLFSNDLDTDPSRLTLTRTMGFPDNFLSLDEHGQIFLEASALEELKYGEGLDLVFDYAVSNGVAEGESEIASVHVQIIGKNEVPQVYDDVYFYENANHSVFEVGVPDGLILRVHVSDEIADSDIDGDDLMIAAISDTPLNSGPPVTWVMMEDGSASLDLPGEVSVIVHDNGSFTMDAPDGFTGTVEFAYLLSDGMDLAGGKATVIVGGPASLDSHLLINEIALQNGSVIRNAYADNGAAPDRIAVGAASIELLNTSDEAVSAASLATLKLEIMGPTGNMTTMSLGDLTGLTQDASGHSLNQFSIPAGGILMIYEPGTLGLGTWAIYGPNKSFIAGASGSYEADAWSLGSMAKEAIAVNLVQQGTSIDFFAANGADIDAMSGIIDLGDRAQDEQDMAGVPWAGDDVGMLSEEQYDATNSSSADTVFGRTTFVDTDSEQDWSHYVFQARTVGYTNTKMLRGTALFVANPEDRSENLNPNQGHSTSEGQDKQLGSGTLVGGGGYDVLVGLDGSDNLFGDELDDGLYGGGGNDSLDGGSGGDWLQGGAGLDQLRGGSGRDMFAFADIGDSGAQVRDVILDFTVNEDKINISIIDADEGLEGNQAFDWGGLVSGLSQAATMLGMLVYWADNGMTVVQADVAGDDLAPMQLVISGVKSLSPEDFVM